jgi:hypothetical protein
MFVRRLLEEEQAQVQQQQANARKAADRGVSAQRLLQAEQNRRRMERALQELESNEVQQRKQDLALDKLTAAPLLRKWHKQKMQAKACLAFKRDFLPGAAPTGQEGLPSFIACGEVASHEQQQQPGVEQRPKSIEQRPATATDRALKLVKELQRQRRAEAAAAAAEQQQQQCAACWPSTTASSVGAEDSEVPVDDLITFIPPVRSPDTHNQPPTPSLEPKAALDAAAAAALAAARAAGTGTGSKVSSSSSSTILAAMLDANQHVGTASALQESAPSSSALDSFGPSLVSHGDSAAANPAAAAADGSLRSSSLEQHQREQGMPESSAGGFTASASKALNSSTSSGGSTPSAAAAVQGRPAEGARALLGSSDSLDAIIAAADEVLRQLPADMQAAAAARAAAAAVPAPGAQQQQQQQDAVREHESLQQSATSSSGLRVTTEQMPRRAGPQGCPADSSAEAATILAELSALQQQLGLQASKPWAALLCYLAFPLDKQQ